MKMEPPDLVAIGIQSQDQEVNRHFQPLNQLLHV